MTDLQSQIDDMFTNAASRKAPKDAIVKSDAEGQAQEEGKEGQEEATEEVSKAEGAEDDAQVTKDEAGQANAEAARDVAEKQQILDGVRKYALSMDLLKNEWAGTINSLEGEKKKAESDRQENLKKAKND